MDLEELAIEVRDDEGKLVYEDVLPISDLGTLDGQFTLDDEARLGYYYLSTIIRDDMDREYGYGVNFRVAEYRKMQRRTGYGMRRRPLAEAVAYLPRHIVDIGDTWRVRRAEIFQAFPMLQYSVLMLTHGTGSLSEVAVCRVKGVERRPPGRIAIIQMTGRRDAVVDPRDPTGGYGRYMDCTGEIRFNLATGRIVSHRIESVLRDWPGGVFDKGCKLVDTLTLAPLKERPTHPAARTQPAATKPAQAGEGTR